MPVSQHEAELVRTGFAHLQTRIQPASIAFYEALFRRRPDLRALFREDLAGQGMKFMSTLGALVDSLDQPQDLADRLKELGHSHAALGVRAEYFPPMGEALIDTLKAELGAEMTPEAETAWRKAYADLTDMMLKGGIP